MPFSSFAGRGQGEMGQKVHASNRGSSSSLMNYLDKEEGIFYDRDNNKLTAEQATQLIDGNTKYLDQTDSKFHSKILSPSQKELKGVSDEKLIEVAHADADEVAKQFNRAGVKRETMVYVVRLEHNRYFEKDEVSNEVKVNEETRQNYVVKNALKKGEKREQFDENGNKIYHVGDRKPGDQRHVHTVFSGQIDREKLAELKASGEIDQKVTRIKISPNITSGNHAKGQGVAKGAFNRVNYKNALEARFDKITGYDRRYSETFEYARIRESPNVSMKEKTANEQKRIDDDRDRLGAYGSGGKEVETPKTEIKKETMENKEEVKETPEQVMERLKKTFDRAKETTVTAPAKNMNDLGPTAPAKSMDLSDFQVRSAPAPAPAPKQEQAPKQEPEVKPEVKQDQKQDQDQKQEQKRDKKRGMGI